MPKPGEPLFLPEDTAAAVALAEEEADTCPACGLPKSWCRDNADGRYKFEVAEDFCWSTYHLALRQDAMSEGKTKSAADKRATQLLVRFREGHEPDLTAGLGLASDPGDEQ